MSKHAHFITGLGTGLAFAITLYLFPKYGFTEAPIFWGVVTVVLAIISASNGEE